MALAALALTCFPGSVVPEITVLRNETTYCSSKEKPVLHSTQMVITGSSGGHGFFKNPLVGT